MKVDQVLFSIHVATLYDKEQYKHFRFELPGAEFWQEWHQAAVPGNPPIVTCRNHVTIASAP